MWFVALALFGRCPHGFWVAGVRPSGSFTCRPTPITRGDRCRTECDDGTPDVELTGRIRCTGGTVPIVINEHAVACVRRGQA